MKKLLLIAIALVTLQVSAQNDKTNKLNNKSAEEIAQMQTERLTKALSLDEAQQKRISILNLQHAKMQEELRSSKMEEKKASKERRMELKKGLESNRNNRDNNMKAILSDEQYAKWTTLKEKQKDERLERRGKK